ncbi:periplasmic [Fe] hydrogenase large subunit [Clostridium tepidiprofundi DSM 19306]|uniref:Periplasmic [Fe] hydrogenase large subunit n=1 Tax=Clostridium tepidiprofundi DSM 19306 TaxID=1121338 RepID=A0A151B3G6_9CLOT|nr:[Fe-Fe] hydrogenase large subunit C-terminal domain-containing protein [Clostridium tepidiprofundi]KYH34330.1 periplasmic [Fe] hydrogenase large subunit [Clostridium tepidiprofundi DSM 19306]
MNKLFRALKLNEENCRGCTKCMNKCPMEAIRLKNSKAVIYEDRCIDCGICIRTCPYNAYSAEKNSLYDIKNYKIKVAIPSTTLYSQFGNNVKPFQINEAVKKLGFDEVFDISYASDITSEIIKKEIDKVEKPSIGVFCPSIQELIKVNYPSLLPHIVKVLTPIEISASLIRDEYLKKGFSYDEVGVFYLSPCVAWIPMIKSSASNLKTKINGIIAINDIYSKIIKNLENKENLSTKPSNISYTGLSWSYIEGASESMGLKQFIAVDGIENVKLVFDDIVNGKFKDVDFVESYACNGGCVGGIFLIENPYNAKRITKNYFDKINFTYGVKEISDYYHKEFSGDVKNIKVVNQKLADDFMSAVRKMKYMNELVNMLPGTDCGLCGSPSCKAFAEDVVRGLASLDECIMIKNGGEKNES